MKIARIEKNKNRLDVYFKIPMFKSYKDIAPVLDFMFNDEFESYLGTGIDHTGKYVIATFVLRSYKDNTYYVRYKGVVL